MAARAQQLKKTEASRLLVAALLVTTALGAALRIYKLGAESIWLDEAFTIQTARGPLPSIIEETSKDVHPPLYYFVIHYWMGLFGESEFSTRLLSALFGSLAILAIYKLAARLFDRATALLAALFLALSVFHIEFSQEARMYTLLCLLTLLSMYFFIELLAAGERNRLALAGYIASSALLLYTHVYSLFIIAAQNLFWLSLALFSKEIFRRLWKRWLLAQAALCVLFLPWLSVLVQQVSRVQKGFWIPRLPPRSLYDTFIIYAGSRQLALIFFPLAALGIFVGWKGRGAETGRKLLPATADESALSNPLKTYLLLWWLVCPVILPFIVSQFTSPIFLPKYTIPASLAFIILVARGFLNVRLHQLRLLLVLLIAVFSLSALRDYYGAVKKDVWRDAVANFDRLAGPNDLVLFNQQSGQSPFDYYNRRTDLIEEPFPDFKAELTADNVAELLRPAVEGHDRVWLVLSHPGPLTPLIAEQLKEWYAVTIHRTDPGVEIYLFEKRR